MPSNEESEPIEMVVTEVREHLLDTKPLLLANPDDVMEEFLDSPFGKISVLKQGLPNRTPILTFHDLGLNGHSQFAGFFEFGEMEKIMRHFCAYHISVPGQFKDSPPIPADAKFPTMDEMADIVDYTIDHLKLDRVIGFGVGAGANVMARAALFYPQKFIALVLINCVSTPAGWIEWANQKLAKFHLRKGHITQAIQNGLLHHHFGYETMETKHDLVQIYADYFAKELNAQNFSRFLESYTHRTDLDVERDDADNHHYNFSCAVMNVTGDNSPHLDAVVEFNGRLNPKSCTFIKLAECGGMVLEEQPAKFTEALMYFLQGLGFVSNLSMTTNSLAYRMHNKLVKERETKKRAMTMQITKTNKQSLQDLPKRAAET